MPTTSAPRRTARVPFAVPSITDTPLYAPIRACTACSLRAGCAGPVPSVGRFPGRILLYGEGPGANEDRLGVPFTGAFTV